MPPSGTERGPVTIRSKSPWGKMSEKLKSVAEPWTSRLSEDPPQSVMAAVYETTSLIWNASRLPDPTERSKTLLEVRRLMAEGLPDLPHAAFEELFSEMHNRASQTFSDDPRIVARISVEKRGRGDFHLAVASMELK